MKRLQVSLFVVMALLAWSNQAAAQYKKGDNLLNLGLGLNSYYSGGIPLSVSYEKGITDDISFGGALDYLSYRYGVPGYDYRFTAIYIGARGSYHFNRLLNLRDENWDIYAGATLGYRSFSWNGNNVSGLGSVYGSGLFLGIHAGARYYFSKSVGAFAELGALGSTNARVGVAFKF